MNASAAMVADSGPDTGDRLTVDVDIRASGWSDAVEAPAELCRRAVAAALASGDATGSSAEVSVVLGDDGFVADLNKRYRNRDAATNVLSFPGGGTAPAGMPAMLGDIAVALETVLAEAADGGKHPADHLAHMIVHGTLHLLGHDHEDDVEAGAMEALEVRALAALGIADPYKSDGV